MALMDKERERIRLYRIAASSVILFLCANAQGEPRTAIDMSNDALNAHFRTSDHGKIQKELLRSAATLRREAGTNSSLEAIATIFFREGISQSRLAAFATEYGFDILRSDAKISLGDGGDTYSVLTNHAPAPLAQIAAKLRAAQKSADPAINELAAEAAPGREATLSSPPVEVSSDEPLTRYFSVSVIGTYGALATIANDNEVRSIQLSAISDSELSRIKSHRSQLAFDPIEAARAQAYGAKKRDQAAITRQPKNVGGLAGTNAGGGGGPPPSTPQPAWFGPFSHDLSTAPPNPSTSKLNLPFEFYTSCSGTGSSRCPNHWTWQPRFNRAWRVGVKAYAGECYLVPSFYLEWENDTLPSINWYWVEVCEEPRTLGSLMSQFQFSSKGMWAPWGYTNILLAAYHDTAAPACDPDLGGVFEMPCDDDTPNVIYVPDSTFEDETQIANPSCAIPYRTDVPQLDGDGCFAVYQIVTNIPAPYQDTLLGDPGTLFKPTVGSANAAAFSAGTLYRSYIYFAARGVNNLVGTQAVHEYEIGTLTPPSQTCGTLCAFKVNEVEVDRATFVAVP